MFEPQVLAEDEQYVDYVDVDGVKRRFQKEEGVIPSALDWPIKDWDSWQALKETRLRLDNIRDRFPANWPEWVEEYKTRDYPLAVGGYPCGFFGTLVHLMGYENVFLKYYDAPDLVTDVLNHFTDLVAIWEISGCDARLLPHLGGYVIHQGAYKEIFTRFMAPCYRRVTIPQRQGRQHHPRGHRRQLQAGHPVADRVGVTGVYPMEVNLGMDVIKARAVPRLQMMGGIEVHGARHEAHRRISGTGGCAVGEGRLYPVRRSPHLARRHLGAVQVLPGEAERADRQQGEPLMRITRLDAYPLVYVEPNDCNSTRHLLLVRVEGASGMCGWGEAVTIWPEPTLAAAEIVRGGLAQVVLGREVEDVEALWLAQRDHMWWYGDTGLACFALSALDTACGTSRARRSANRSTGCSAAR